MLENDVGITLSADDKALLQVLRGAGADIQAFAKQGGNAMRDLQDAARGNTTAMERLAGGMKTAFIGGGIAAGIITVKNAVESVTASMIDAQMQADKVKNSLSFAMGGPQAAQEIQYLRKVTDQLGVSFANVAPMYGRLAAATKGTNLEGRATREIFESIAQASVVMGLGVEETEGAMRALVQMVSKGQIQAEELRGQLGERLPRAFQLFAESMGVSTGELSKMLETGKVGTERLAQFAATLKGALAGDVDEATTRLAASVNRLDNAWLRLKQSISDSGVSTVLASGMNTAASEINFVSKAMDDAKESGRGFVGQMLSAAAAYHLFPVKAISGLFADHAAQLREAEKQLKEYEALLSKDPTNTFLIRGIQQIKETVVWLQAANAEKNKFAASGPSHRQMEDASMAKWAEQQAQQVKDLADIKAKLNHVDKDYLLTLQKLNDAWKSGALTQAEYVDLVGKLAAANYKAEKATHAHADAFAEFIKKVNEKIAAQALELDSGRKVSESDKLRIQFNEELGTKYKHLTAAQLAQVDALLKALKAGEEQEKTLRRLKLQYQEQVAFQEEAAAAYVAESKAREQGRLSVDAWVRAQEEAVAQQQLELSLFGASERNRSIALDQYRIELDLKKQLHAVDANLAFDEAQRDEERARLRAAADRAKAAAVTKADMQELQGLWASFDSTAHDVFVNIFNDGSNAFKKLGQSLKAGLIDVLYQLTLKRWIINIGASLTGGTIAGTANAATGGLGDIGSLISGAGSLGTVGSTVAGWMGLGGATAAGMAANVGIGTAAGLTVAEATAAASAAGAAAGSGLMTTLGPLMTAAPYLAAIAGVYMIAKQLDHSGTPHTGGGSQYSAAGGLLDARSSTFASGFTGIAYSDSTTQMTAGVVQSIVGILDSTAQAFGQKAGYTAAASFADDSSKDGAWGSLRIADAVGNALTDWQANGVSFRKFSDGSAGSAEYLAAISADVRRALDGIDVPDWARAMLTKLGDAPSLDQLAATVAQINQVQNAITAQRAGLQQQYDLLAGVTTQRELERAALDESNRALYDQIQALQDQKDAADAAAQAAKAVADERATLQDQLDALLLTPEQLLAKQRNALDESNRALFDQIQAATAAKDAQEALAAAQAQQAEQARAAAEALIERARTSAASLLEYQRTVARIRDAQAATLGGSVAAVSSATSGPSAAVVVAPVASGSATAGQSVGVVEAVTALRADFAAQMEGLRAETRAIVKTTSTTASILTRVTPKEDGISTYTVS